MLKHISVLSMTVLLAACGGAGTPDQNGEIDGAPELGAALSNDVTTASLEFDKDFSFATARSVDIDFDIAAVQGEDATVTICTDYTPTDDVYDIDFNSCTISGKLSDGTFNQSMEVTNDKDAVVAVVLFQDPSIEPMYKEFYVDNNQRSKADGSSSRVIVWK